MIKSYYLFSTYLAPSNVILLSFLKFSLGLHVFFNIHLFNLYGRTFDSLPLVLYFCNH